MGYKCDFFSITNKTLNLFKKKGKSIMRINITEKGRGIKYIVFQILSDNVITKFKVNMQTFCEFLKANGIMVKTKQSQKEHQQFLSHLSQKIVDNFELLTSLSAQVEFSPVQDQNALSGIFLQNGGNGEDEVSLSQHK